MIPLMRAAFDNAESRAVIAWRKRWIAEDIRNLLQMIEMFVSCFLVVVSQIHNCHSSNDILRYSLLCVNYSSIKLLRD